MKKCSILLIVFVFLSCSNDSNKNKGKDEPLLYSNKKSWEKFDDAYKEKLNKELKKTDYSKYTKKEKKIYDYMQSIWDSYEAKYGISAAENKVFEKTAKKFGISTSEVLKIFNKVDRIVIGY